MTIRQCIINLQTKYVYNIQFTDKICLKYYLFLSRERGRERERERQTDRQTDRQTEISANNFKTSIEQNATSRRSTLPAVLSDCTKDCSLSFVCRISTCVCRISTCVCRSSVLVACKSASITSFHICMSFSIVCTRQKGSVVSKSVILVLKELTFRVSFVVCAILVCFCVCFFFVWYLNCDWIH